MQLEKTDVEQELSAEAVYQYLIQQPDFFINHHDILSRLQVPHESGGAVSLIEKQVSVLRGRCTHLEKSLYDLIAVARQNETVHQRLHSLIQEIITAKSLNDIVSLTRECLQENFNADNIYWMLIAPATKLSLIHI